MTLIGWKDFLKMVREHRHDMMEVVHLPKEHVWKETRKVDFKIDSTILKKTCIFESRIRFRVAKDKLNHINKNKAGENEKTYRKDIVHSFRYVLFATQILEHGRIVNYGIANEIYSRVISEETIDIHKYQNLHSELIDNFKTVCGKEKLTFYNKFQTESISASISNNISWKRGDLRVLKELKVECQKKEKHALKIVSILREGTSLCEIQKKFLVFVSGHSVHKQLWMLSKLDCNLSGSENEEELSSLILDCNNEWSPISLKVPPRHMQHVHTNHREGLEIEFVQQFLDEFSLCLYFYGNEWQVSSDWFASKPTNPLGWTKENSKLPTNGSFILSELFWKVWEESSYRFPEEYKHCCFSFQLVTKKHRFVFSPKNYSGENEDCLVLTGALDMNSLCTVDIQTLSVCLYLLSSQFISDSFTLGTLWVELSQELSSHKDVGRCG